MPYIATGVLSVLVKPNQVASILCICQRYASVSPSPPSIEGHTRGFDNDHFNCPRVRVAFAVKSPIQYLGEYRGFDCFRAASVVIWQS